MKKRDLLLKMKEELSNYQIGLHNIGLKKYISMLGEWNPNKDLYKLTGAKISEQAVAEHIIQTGLHVVERCIGLTSTVKFIEELNDKSLDYTYNQYSVGKVWNVIVAIPESINYQGNNYYLGDLRYCVNFGNMMFLNPNVAPIFIYGYYQINIEKFLETDFDAFNIMNNVIYSEDIEFYPNPNFYGILTDEEKEKALQQIFQNNKRLIKVLKLANSDSRLGTLFTSSYERFIIGETRKQKRLTYNKRK